MNDPQPPSTLSTSSPAPSPRRTRLLLALLASVGGAAIVLVFWPRRTNPPPAADPFPPPPFTPSPYLNTRPEARYVGKKVCRGCHEGQYASFRRTGMARSMAEVDAAREPPDGAFDHPPSKRRYQVRRRDGQLWHRELLLTGQAPEVVLSDYPVRYVVGSGHHSRSYLVEVDGFLVESPVTWYTSRHAWGMSPGYEGPNQMGFQRPVGEGCLICHAGRAEAVGGSLHRMHVSAIAIDCERCHGPGSLHVQRHAGRPAPIARSREADYTIVNSTHLPRELAEAICQQCHLQSRAVILTRGRTFADFRPGLPLQDFRQDYMLQPADGDMTVVGHVEQMHRSRCYQASDTLSCLTCHDPHDEPRPWQRTAYYQSVCLRCHRPERCTVDIHLRRRESPDNDCVHCHMPRAPTENPHLSFTHHRIGIHGKPSARDEGAVKQPGGAKLRPFLDLTRLPEVDRKRSLGLGYLEVANQETDARRRAQFWQPALDLLSEARTRGLRDPALDAGLARLYADMGVGDVVPFAESALALPARLPHDRCNALSLLAEAQARQGRYSDAAAALRQLTRLRRYAVDWLLLAA